MPGRPPSAARRALTAVAVAALSIALATSPAPAEPQPDPAASPTPISAAAPSPTTGGLLPWPDPAAVAADGDAVDIADAETADQAVALQAQAMAAEQRAADLEAQIPAAVTAAAHAHLVADQAVARAALLREEATAATQDVDTMARNAYMGSGVPVLASFVFATTPQQAVEALTFSNKIEAIATHTVHVAKTAQQRAADADVSAADALARASAADVQVTYLREQATHEHEIADAAYAAFKAYISAPAPQTEIGPDGCPIATVEGTLRDGSEMLGAPELCRRSVAAAATPQAALAIKFTFARLGAPYACKGIGRMEPFRFDCSSLVSRAYFEGAGIPVAGDTWAPSTRNMMPWDGVNLDPHYIEVPVEEIKPGDLLLYRSCTQAPCIYQHVTMALSDGYMLHTNSCGDVAHVSVIPGLGPEANFVVARRVVLLGAEQVTPSPEFAGPTPAQALAAFVAQADPLLAVATPVFGPDADTPSTRDR